MGILMAYGPPFPTNFLNQIYFLKEVYKLYTSDAKWFILHDNTNC